MEGKTVYKNGTVTPGAMNFIDKSLGAMVKELKAKDLYNSTEIIIEAKHGQSPIDPTKLAKIGHAETKVLTAAGIKLAQVTDDDVALIWLADQSQTNAAVAALEADKAGKNTAHIAKVLHGDQLAELYNNPKTDSRTPDIIVLPTPGTIYTGSVAKVAEHGGFSPDDTHIALLVVNGGGHGTVDEHVTTTQIAPTILKTLGLNPNALDAVKMEGTRPLPGSGD
jgi:predicted AlkP superfamily pyrophosphatase or phosphodiesterase